MLLEQSLQLQGLQMCMTNLGSLDSLYQQSDSTSELILRYGS